MSDEAVNDNVVFVGTSQRPGSGELPNIPPLAHLAKQAAQSIAGIANDAAALRELEQWLAS